MKKTFKLFTFFSLALLLVFTGCSGRCQVKGTVKMADGTPLTVGVVNFTDGEVVLRGEIKRDGTYQMRTFKPGDGIDPGRYNVYLTETLSLSGGNERTTRSGESGDDEMSWQEVGQNASTIDLKYSDPVNSGLVCDVKKSMTYDIIIE
ncbi:MAG: hypothetical protein ACOX0A_09720 [Thermoguttaceae bacterium]|jgi:hypothetical protein